MSQMNPASDSPTCEIITIGSELLLGQIEDTNTTYLSRHLGRAGLTISFRTAVGDRLEDIEEVIRHALKRCDMVMTTGGLGPTMDDLTREAVARTAGVKLEFRQDLMDQIEGIFRRYGYQMPENNRRQAFVPSGSRAIPNPVGTAPGFVKEIHGRPVICLPGVPRELKFLLDKEVLPFVRERFGLVHHRISSRVLKVVGLGESSVDRLIADLIKEGTNPEIGLLASEGEIKIRIVATGKDDKNTASLIGPLEKEIRSRLGRKIYGRDDDKLEGVIHSLLDDRGLTLAILETFSGGLAAQKLYRPGYLRLLESRVIPDPTQLEVFLNGATPTSQEDIAAKAAQRAKDLAGAGIGLAILGFPEKKEGGYTLKGSIAAVGEGVEKTFSWEMGGGLLTIQQRGAIIGLNTLRLALLDADA